MITSIPPVETKHPSAHHQSNNSILLKLQLPEHQLTACLLDPMIPLLRGYSSNFCFTLIQPPTKPYIQSTSTLPQSTTSSQATSHQPTPSGVRSSVQPYQRPEPMRNSRPDPSLVELAPLAFVGKARRKPPTVETLREPEQHASLEGDISAAVEAIRLQWIETSHLRDHSEWWALDHRREQCLGSGLPRFRWLDQAQGRTIGRDAPNWATITSERGSPSETSPLTHLNHTPNTIRLTPTAQAYPIYLPPRSGFTLSLLEDFHHLVQGLNHNHGWDAIVLDPPWENKSVARGAKYQSIELYDLFKIKIPQMLGENGGKRALVAIWVTNRPKFRRFLMNKFMPDSYIIGPFAEWYWVKITASPLENGQRDLRAGGRPIFDLSSSSPRRCYEGLILGWYHPPSLRSAGPVDQILPHKKVFLSTPLDHSRKPNLSDLLQPYLPPEANFLELFARTASCTSERDDRKVGEGIWHSIGNESPKFNGPPWIQSKDQDEDSKCDD